MSKSPNVETRNKLQEIPRRATLIEMLEAVNISDSDRDIMRMRYIEGKEWGYIADTLGYSLSAVKRRHAKILGKISKII